MPLDPEIRIVGDRVQVWEGGELLSEAPLSRLLTQLRANDGSAVRIDPLPHRLRLLRLRREVVGMVVEHPPHARTVRWIADGSRPYGPKARYRDVYLEFPFVVLLLVFRDGTPTGFQQLYYSKRGLDVEQDLYLPNLLNVAKGYEQRCWVCLQHLPDVSQLPWVEKLNAIVDHVFTAAWNRSAEEHEGNSYWSAMKGLDRRVSSVQAWERETRKNRGFACEVPWKRAGTTAPAELDAMMDRVLPAAQLGSARDLVGLIARGSPRSRRDLHR